MNPDSQVNQGSEDPRRGLPSVDRLARAVSERLGEAPAWAVTEAARTGRIGDGKVFLLDEEPVPVRRST